MCVKAIEAVRKHKRVAQVGLMQRSSAPFMEAYKEVQSGSGPGPSCRADQSRGSAPRQDAARRAAQSGQPQHRPSLLSPGLDWRCSGTHGARSLHVAHANAIGGNYGSTARWGNSPTGRAPPGHCTLVHGVTAARACCEPLCMDGSTAAGRVLPRHDRSRLAISEFRCALQFASEMLRDVSVGR